MGSILIVEAQPVWQCGAALFGSRVGHCVSPFPLQCLDEALRFAVRLGPVGSCPFSDDAEPAACFAERPRAISPAVVGQHALNADAATLEFAHGTQPEASRGVALLIRQDFDVAKPRAGCRRRSELAA